MAKSCLWRPSKGNTVFSRLKPQVGYNKAWDVIGVASNDKFIAKYKESLSFDAEGFPTYQSLLDNDYIQKNVIGLQDVAKIKSKDFSEVEDTLTNYGNLLEQALKYNRENTNSNFIAIVEYSENGIKINLREKNDANIDTFKKQYAVYKLNQRLGNLLASLGITPQMLSQEEVKAGRAGSTQFIAALGMANSAVALIKIANNMEGNFALTEEFAHVLVDALHDNPLMQRALNAISDGSILEQILGDEFDELMEFYNGDIDMVAEEAIGQILRDKLIEGTIVQIDNSFNDEAPKKIEGLLTRLKNYILNLFKRLNYQDAIDAITEANNLMATLSEDLLSEKIKITKVNARARNAVFNALSDRIDRNIKVLKEAIETETKRSKLLHEDISLGKRRIEQLNRYANDRNNTALGVMIYAHKGLKMLQNAKDSLDNFELLSFEDQVKALRTTKTILQSYGTFIDTFNEILNDEEGREDDLFEGEFEVKKGVKVEAAPLLKDINDLVKRITAQYATTASPIFIKFLKDSLGDEVIDLLLKHAGDNASIEDLLKHSSHDISFSDLWLDAMRDSANPILQAYDKVVKNANDRARMKAIDMFKEIQNLRQMAEAEGITDFEFMFEKDKNGHKSGNYVNPNYNWAEYYRQRRVFEKELEEKYGENPTGENKKKANRERREWLEKYTDLVGLDRRPKASAFPPTKLTSSQQKVLSAFIEYKKKIDKLYPETRVSDYKAIQVRKDNIQRLMDGGINPITMYKNWKEDLKNTYLDSSDDDQLFGQASSGLMNFDGTEYMRLPVLYSNRLRNPDELSTDVFGSLYAYAAAATKYEQMEKIVQPLELGRDIIEGRVSDATKMQVNQTRGQKKVVETINHLGQKIKKPAIMSGESNLFKKLDTFMECQVYQRYLKDEGTFEVFGNKIKTTKVTSRLLQLGATAQLGFNWLANLANATTGVAMQNIEAFAGQYFTAKELATADGIYASLIPSFMSESYARSKTNKLALFDELFDVRQDFGNSKHHTERSNLLRRIFGKNIQFLGQEAGDHWLYNRTAIAMVKHIKVKYKGKETSLWDVLQIREHEGTKVKEMYVPEGVVDMLGNTIDKERIGKISRKIAAVNHSLFGIYNEEDMNAANRVSLGRILLQYRKWMKPQFNRRFEAKRTDLDLGEEIEGYYRTAWRISNEVVRELKRGEFQFTVWKDNLSDMEKANIKRCLVELVQFAAIALLVLALGTDDDDDDWYITKLGKYAANRLLHETGNLAPSYTMIQELLKTVKSPASILGPMEDTSAFVGSLFNPWQWNDELQSGDYKGHSHLYKNTMKLPIPILAHIRQFNRAYNGLDKAITYYTNPDYK